MGAKGRRSVPKALRQSALHLQDTVFIVPSRTHVKAMSLQMAQRLKTAQVNLRIDPALKAAAEKAAAADKRTLTSLVEKLLDTYLRERGFLPEPGGNA